MVEIPTLPPSGINVLIVGAGFGGLCAAIECHRKGHSVTLLEKVAELKPLGDIISFGQNGTRIFERWPGVMDELDPIIHKSDSITYHDWQGRFVTTQSFANERPWGRRINAHRGELHMIVFRYAASLGIDIRLGVSVVDYFETEDAGGVVLADGTRMTADVVLAAEGVKSRGRKIVLGSDDRPLASGYAVFRAWFPSDDLRANPLTRHLVEADSHTGWIGQDIHFLVAAVKDGKEVSWVATHKDDADIEENWQFPGKVEDALACLEGWDPVARAIIAATPPGRLFDYKLAFRDPLPRFVSPGGRVVLIGDAAHPFLPTSIQGASQSMEDGVTLAACLDKCGGRDHVKEALRVYQAIRYERVHAVQKTGVATREQWHKADWDAIWKNPESLHLKREQWILGFDAEKHAYEVYDKVRDQLRNGEVNGTPKEPDVKTVMDTAVKERTVVEA